MKIEQVKVSELKPIERNIRRHPEKQLQELKRSFKMFGQTRPLVIDDDNVILVGNGLFQALSQMEESIETVSVLRMKGLSEKDKRKLMIADNKTFELGLSDQDNIMFNLEFITDGMDVDIPGYDEDFLKNLLGPEDDLNEVIESYGKIDPETTDKIKEAFEQTEQEVSEKEPTKEVVLTNDEIEIEDDDGKARPFIVCKKCGEKIWL